LTLTCTRNLSLMGGAGRGRTTTSPPWPLRISGSIEHPKSQLQGMGHPYIFSPIPKGAMPTPRPQNYTHDWWDPPSGRLLTTVPSRAKGCLDTTLQRFSPALLSLLTGSVFWYLKIPISLGSRISAASAREDTHLKVCQIPKQKVRQHLSTKQKRTSKEMSEGCNNIGNNNRANNSYYSHLKKKKPIGKYRQVL